MPSATSPTPYVPAVTLDRKSPIPLYYQVAQQLEAAIESGALRPGARLPNEIELAGQLALSRPTMRQAISHLVDKGLVVRKRGVGTQVVGATVRRSLELTSLHDDLADAGRHPSTTVYELRTAPAPADAAAALDVAPATPVTLVRRLRSASGEPLALLTNYLPSDVLDPAGTDLQNHGLYATLRDGGVRLRVARQTIGARSATDTEAAELAEPAGAALLTMTRTAYDDTGRAVEYGTHLYRASRYAFELTLVDR